MVMVGETLIYVGASVFVLGSGLNFAIGHVSGHSVQRLSVKSLGVLALAMAASGIFVKIAASQYLQLFTPFPEVALSPHESEYFAVQVMTTVGFGSALIPASPTAPPALVSSFQQLSKWLMLPLMAVWAFAISALIHLFRPRER